MALLRPCGKLARKFGKSIIICQVDNQRCFADIARKRGYVTVAPKLCCVSVSVEKSENPNAIISNETNPTFTAYSQFLTLCFNKKNAEIRKQDLARILEENEIDEKNSSPDSMGLSLLRLTSRVLPNVKPDERRNLTNVIWGLIEEKLNPPTLRHYNTLLSVYASNSQTVDPTKFLENMRVAPDVETYRLLLNCSAKVGDVESTLYVVALMKRLGVAINEGIFNSIVEAYAARGDISSVLANLDLMKDAEIAPSEQTYSSVACAWASLGRVTEMTKILDSHKLSVEQSMSIVRRLSLSGNGEHIPKVLKFLPADADFTNFCVVNQITELLYEGKAEDSLALVCSVTTDSSTDKRDAFLESYLANLVRAGTPTGRIIKIVDELAEKKKYPCAMTDACRSALEYEKRELALALFEVMHERNIAVRAHYYWPVLSLATKDDGEAEIFRTIKHMLCLNVPLDYDTYFYYVLPHVNTTDILCAVRKFADIGIEPSKYVTPLINHLLLRGNYEDSLILCAKYKLYVDFPSIVKPLFFAYKNNRNVDNCAKILKHAPPNKHLAEEFLMIQFGREPRPKDAPAVDKFLRAFEAHDVPVTSFQECNEHGSSSLVMINPLENLRPAIPHPRDMDIEQLECHLIELRAKEMNMRGVLRKLLLLHGRQNNIERVDEIKKEYDDNGYLWTSGMYSVLLQVYIRNGRMKEAQHLYKMLREYHTDFKIDDLKIVQFAIALVENKQIDDVITILGSARSKGGPILAKECWRLLNAIAHSKFSEMTEDILDILVNAGYCGRTNVILGPLIRRHLLNDDLETATHTFKSIAEKYRCTPLRQELINALVKSMKTDDSTRERSVKLLREVQTIDESIHGPGGTRIDLLLSLARNEMTEELKKFCKKNYLSGEMIVKSVERVSEEEKLKILPKILDSCTNMPKIQRMTIYEKFLSSYNRSGNCRGAIELWDKMSKETLIPSRLFTTEFVNLLKKHNVPLPEDFEGYQ